MNDSIKRTMDRKTGPVALIVALVSVYAVICLFIYMVADSMVFTPPDPTYGDTPEVIKLRTSDGTTISAVHKPNPNASHTVLYSHGSAEDVGQTITILDKFNKMGLSAFSYDYHGYGTSGGKTSEEAAYQDIEAAYDYVTSELNIPPSRVILYGYSLGSGPAVDLAVRKPVGGLILEGAFLSALRVHTGYRILPFDMFENIRKIGEVDVPVMVIHGTKDKVVPFSHSQELYRRAKGSKTNLWVEDADHFNIMPTAGLGYNKKVLSFIRSIAQPSEAQDPG